MRKNTVSSMLAVAFLFALIMGGYQNANAGEYQSLENSRWRDWFVGQIVNDKGVSRPVSLAVTSFISAGEQANVIFFDKGKINHLVVSFLDKYVAEGYLPSGVKLILKRQPDGSIAISSADPGGLNPADGNAVPQPKKV